MKIINNIKENIRSITLRTLYRLIRYIDKDKFEDSYNFLTPSSNAQNIDEYSKALRKALDRPGINNIAITGPYGSGKSSFINSFISKNPQYNPIFLSLATFQTSDINEEKESNGENGSSNVRLEDLSIEKRLIKQLFYQAKPSKIPLSKFKRINEPGLLRSFSSMVLIPLAIIYLSIYALWFFKSGLFEKFIDKFNYSDSNSLFYLFLILFILNALYLSQKIRVYLKGRSLRLINLKSLEFKDEASNESSVFDRNLDEILYFFDSHNYDVVVIEDLDRNKDIEIFTKFRELNNLINSYINRKERIRFLYAVGDELFDKKTRVKFFDFIIPIIPYINPSNSYTKFLKLFENHIKEDNLKKSLLRNVSYVIDDFRLLTNIFNEYLVYRANVYKGLDKNKLFALIVYKNIHPKEFSRLHTSENKDAILKKIFSIKELFADELKGEVNNELEETREKLYLLKDSINFEVTSTHKQLKTIYLLEMFSLINNHNVFYIHINNGKYGLQNYGGIFTSLDNNFKELKQNGFQTLGRNGNIVEKYSFEDLQKRISPSITFSERKQLIEKGFGNSILQPIETKILDLENQILDIELKNISQLIELPGAEQVIFDELDCDLTKYLVRNGFIDENYNSYMSYFFEGGLSHKDVEYSLKLESQIVLSPDTKVPNARELLYVLDDRDFLLPNILNYDIANSLIARKSDDELKNKYSIFLKLLCSQTDRAIRFVFSDLFFENLINILPDLAKNWDGLWDVFIKERSTQPKVEKLLSAIVNNLKIDVISNLNKNDGLTKKIELIDSLNIFNPANNYHSQKVIDLLNIKFVRLTEISDNIALFKYIYKNGHFECFPNIVKLIAHHIANNESLANKVDSSYLTSIYKLNLEQLTSAYESKINYYIESVAFTLSDSIEDVEILISLLNHDEVDFELKKQFFFRYSFSINNILDIDKNLWPYALKNNSIDSNWSNLLNYFNFENELSKTLIDFINSQSNYTRINENLTTSLKDVTSEEDNLEEFAREIIESNELNDDSYLHLIPLILIEFDNLEIGDISKEKIDLLIKSSCFGYSKTHIINLRDNSKSKIEFIYRHLELFSEELVEERGYTQFEFNDNDYVYLLNDKRIDIEYFEFFVSYINFELLHLNTINKISNLILTYKEFDQTTNQTNPTISLSFSIINTLLRYSDDLKNCLDILILNINSLTIQDIRSLLDLLPDPYDQLSKVHVAGMKNPLIDINEVNTKLLELLKRKGVISSFKERKSIWNNFTGKNQYMVNLKRK